MALNANALTTLAKAKSHLKILDASQDSILEIMINTASSVIEQYVDRKLQTQTHTEYQDGRRQNRILLKQYPVTGVSQVWVDQTSAFTDVTTQLAAGDFFIEDENLVVLNPNGSRGIFPIGTRNIKIVYTAGVHDQQNMTPVAAPSDIEYACLLTTEWLYRFRSREDIGRSQKTKGDENSTVSQDLPQIVRTLLDPHKRSEFPGASLKAESL
jgi:uncharacterized phiE125 gp8 family phage protein